MTRQHPDRRRSGRTTVHTVTSGHETLLDPKVLRRLAESALLEDHAWQDVTTDPLVPDEQQGRARVIAKANGVIAGLPMAIAVMGSPELKKKFRELPPHLLAHGGILGTEAAIAAWTRSQIWLEEMVGYLERNRDFLIDFVRRELPDVRVQAPQATYLAWLDCRHLELQPDPWTFFLETARVALSKGEEFAGPGGHLRLNFGTSRAILTEILERMATAASGRK